MQECCSRGSGPLPEPGLDSRSPESRSPESKSPLCPILRPAQGPPSPEQIKISMSLQTSKGRIQPDIFRFLSPLRTWVPPVSSYSLEVTGFSRQ